MALNLAEEAAVAFGATGQERQDLISAALCVGEWLAEQGRPGRWDTVDPAAVLELMSFATDDEGNAFLLSLVGLLGHAAFHEQLPIAATREILLQIQGLTKNPAVSTFAAQAAAQLNQCLD